MPELIMRSADEVKSQIQRIHSTLDRLASTPERLFPNDPHRAAQRAHLLATTRADVQRFTRKTHSYSMKRLEALDRTFTWNTLQITLVSLLSHCVDAESRRLTESMMPPRLPYYQRAPKDSIDPQA